MSLPIKIIKLPSNIEINVMELPGNGFNKANVVSDLRDFCPHCNDPDCYFDCEQSQINAEEAVCDFNGETQEDVVSRIAWNASVDGLEALLTACASTGVEVESKNFSQAVKQAIQTIKNYYW